MARKAMRLAMIVEIYRKGSEGGREKEMTSESRSGVGKTLDVEKLSLGACRGQRHSAFSALDNWKFWNQSARGLLRHFWPSLVTVPGTSPSSHVTVAKANQFELRAQGELSSRGEIRWVIQKTMLRTQDGRPHAGKFKLSCRLHLPRIFLIVPLQRKWKNESDL
ncbi:hypothetical protein E4U23_005798 [Claviceps purpurea]|nr:hypothetical protein E4U23_005798 [Claviceps purpurea]